MFGGFKTKVCAICNKPITVNNIKKHMANCDIAVKVPKRLHVDYDPNSGYSNGTRVGWNKGLTKNTSDAVRRCGETWSSRNSGRPCKESTKRKLSISLKGRIGGYKVNGGRSTRYAVTDSFGTACTLQSSYELQLSEILNKLALRWIRPAPLTYVLNDKSHKYYPDFYLCDYKIYLDPKNDYLIKIDDSKIRAVREQRLIKLAILSKADLTESRVKDVLRMW